MEKEPEKKRQNIISISMDQVTFDRLNWILNNIQYKSANSDDYRRINRSEFIKSLINDYFFFIYKEIEKDLEEDDKENETNG